MCGIVGACAQRDVAPVLLAGLKRLEYRGYDSAGVAVVTAKDQIQRIRKLGKVCELEEALQAEPIQGHTGIAHTRWATHGKPSEVNAHPHMSGSRLALVHNGIIENFSDLKQELASSGYQTASETDSEIIVHMLHYALQQEKDLIAAVQTTVKKLQGAYSIAITDASEPGRIIAVRSGSPLVVGLGIGENFIASDSHALAPFAQNVIYLEEGDLVDIQYNSFKIYSADGKAVTRAIHEIKHAIDAGERGEYRHYMQKEIFEQPEAVAATLESRLGKDRILEEVFGEKASEIFDKTKSVQIVACGTSYHAGMVARYWIERLAGVACRVEVASEFRYRTKVVPEGTLFVTISQSGETADTLAALRQAQELGYLATLVICNVPESSLVRESDLVFMTRAGVEIGVASTKAFTTQLSALLMLTVAIGRRHSMSAETEASIVQQLKALPKLLLEALALDFQIEQLAKDFADKDHALFLGRGEEYPIALEGALKLKEISYIHAEAYPAGELKHGPLALVDKNMPVIAVAPNDQLLEKLKSNLQEVSARGGKLIIFADHHAKLDKGNGFTVFDMPKVPGDIVPIVYTLPLQLLAYHVALIKGTDVDQPRNLAKSVTVE